MNAKQIYDAIGQVAPFDSAESWDNPGLLVGSPQAEADPLGLALDITPQVLAAAKEKGIQTILTHHPVIFHPLKQVRQDSPVFQLIQSGITVISAHTNLDRSPQLGTNRVLAERWAFGTVPCPRNWRRWGFWGNFLPALPRSWPKK